MKKRAFTLVELIVVITILIILGTIAFLSLQGYSSESRDSKRISDLGNIRKGLEIFQVENDFLPEPEENVVIFSGSQNLLKQGFFGENLAQKLRINGEIKDPLSDEYYIYSTNSQNTKYQLLSFLELENNKDKISFINKTYSFEKKYIYSIGYNLGIFLTDDKTPIQKNYSTGINLNENQEDFNVIFSDEEITSSGTILYEKILEKSKNNGTTIKENSSGTCEFENSNFDECNFE